MKLAYQQLTQHLTKSLASIYVISSDELLLAEEALAAIRTAAEQKGFSEYVIINPDTSADLEGLLYNDTHSLSLFAAKKIVKLNLNLIKLNATTGKLLAEYAAKPSPDILLVILAPKLDAKTEKSAWYQTIEKSGIVIPIWPLNVEQLPAWIMQRAKKLNLILSKTAAERLAVLVEGNLLAAAQEIEKLSLLQSETQLTEQMIEDIVTDHSHFDIFNLVESVLLGNAKRSIHILQNLAAEDTEPTIILWALVREIRMLAEMQQQIKQGKTLGSLFPQFRIWEKRQPGVRAFLQRHKLEACWNFLLKAAQIDRIIKGAEPGDVWVELEKLVCC